MDHACTGQESEHSAPSLLVSSGRPCHGESLSIWAWRPITQWMEEMVSSTGRLLRWANSSIAIPADITRVPINSTQSHTHTMNSSQELATIYV